MKNKRGFTLIELIAVIVILGLVLLIAVPFFSGSLRTFRDDYYNNIIGNITNAGETFFSDNRTYLPHNYLESQIIDINTLEKKRYISSVKDYNRFSCDTKDSYVIAVKLSKDEYAYTTCLKCSSDEFDNFEKNDYCGTAWTEKGGYRKVEFGEAKDVHIYRGTSRSDLKKLVVTYPTVMRCLGKEGDPCTKESGTLVKEVTAAGEEGVEPVYPYDLDKVDTNKVGTYIVNYKYNDYQAPVQGRVVVYENIAPTVSIKKTNKVLRVNQDPVNGAPHTINPSYDDTNPDDWAQELNFTFKYNFGEDANPGLKVASYQYKINGRWEDYCTEINNNNVCTRSEIREMNEDVPFRMIDSEGHISAETRAFTLKIDRTKPKCEVYETGTMGDDSWYVSDVTIRFRSKSDQQGTLLFPGARSAISGESYSGITTGTILSNTINYQKTDTNKVRWYGYIEDKANNYNTCYVEFKRDATAPICELKIPDVDGENGWFVMAGVKVDFKTHTDTSGQTDYSGVRDYGIGSWDSGVKQDFQLNDNDKASWTGQIRDNAGNMSTCTIGFKKDSTPPTCTAKVPTPTGLEDEGKRWHVIPSVKVEINTTYDNLSGVNDYGIDVFNGEKSKDHTADTRGITYTYQIKDNAGNINTCSVWFKKDSTKPSCSVTTSGTKGQNGWYKRAGKNSLGTVTGSFTSHTDATSYVLDYGFDRYNGSKTASTQTSTSNGKFTGVIKDKAGNEATCETTFKLDNANPTCTTTTSHSNWTNGTVTITGNCSDTGGSGCKPNTTARFSDEQNRDQTPANVADNAGNEASCQSIRVKIDKTKPNCSVTKTSTGGTGGISTSVSCSDSGGSGYNCPSGSTGLKSNKTYTVTDGAGNSNTCSVSVESYGCNWSNCKTGSPNACKGGYTYSYSSCRTQTRDTCVSSCGGTNVGGSCSYAAWNAGACVYNCSYNSSTSKWNVKECGCSRSWNSCLTTENTCQGGYLDTCYR